MRAFDADVHGQVEKELDAEEGGGAACAESAQGGGGAGAAVDNLAFLREVDEHQAMLAENIRRAELLSQRMHEDCASRRRQARQRAKDALLQAAAAAAEAANSKIDDLKLELTRKLASRSRPASALVGAEGGRVQGGVAADD